MKPCDRISSYHYCYPLLFVITGDKDTELFAYKVASCTVEHLKGDYIYVSKKSIALYYIAEMFGRKKVWQTISNLPN